MIRPPRDTDFRAITAITNHYITTTSIHFAYEPVADAELLAQWTASRERFPWLVIEDAGAVVGYAKAGTWRERAAYQWTAETGLYIADSARGRGFGKAIYVELLAELTHRKFRSAVAGITLPNDPSVALHLALGFTPVGTFREVGYKLDAWHDVGFWQRPLSEGGVSSPSAVMP